MIQMLISFSQKRTDKQKYTCYFQFYLERKRAVKAVECL